MNNEDLKYEEEITKSKMIAITVISVIVVLCIIILSLFFSIKKASKNISKKNYYFIDVNNDNREKIISLIKDVNGKYCESIYKIDYHKNFSSGVSYHVYCKDEKDLYFGNDNDYKDILNNYIYENGEIEVK